MAKNILLKKEFEFFQDKGFLIKRSFFKNKEIEKIINTIEKDPNFKFLFNYEMFIIYIIVFIHSIMYYIKTPK